MMEQKINLQLLKSCDNISLRDDFHATTSFKNKQMDVYYDQSSQLVLQLENGFSVDAYKDRKFLGRLLTGLVDYPVKPVLDMNNRIRLVAGMPAQNEQQLEQGYNYLKGSLIQAAGVIDKKKYRTPENKKYEKTPVTQVELEGELLDGGSGDFSVEKVDDARFMVYIETPRFYEKVNILPDYKSFTLQYNAYLTDISVQEFNSEPGHALILYLLHTLRDFPFVKPVVVQQGREIVKLGLQIIVPFFLRSVFTVEMAVRKLFAVLYVVKHPVAVLAKKETAGEYLSVVWDL